MLPERARHPCNRRIHESSTSATRCSANPVAARVAHPDLPRECTRFPPLSTSARAPHIHYSADAVGLEEPEEFRELTRGVSDRVDHGRKLSPRQSRTDSRDSSHNAVCDVLDVGYGRWACVRSRRAEALCSWPSHISPWRNNPVPLRASRIPPSASFSIVLASALMHVISIFCEPRSPG